MRVAVVIPAHWDWSMGGSEYQAMLLIEQLYEMYNAEVGYFAARVSAQRDFRDHRVFKVGENNSLRRFGHFWDFFSLQAALREFSPHVIYQRVSCSYAGIAVRYAKRTGTPTICHISSENDCRKADRVVNLLGRPHAIIESRLAKKGIAGADVIVAQTRDQVDLLEKNFARSSRLIRNFHPLPSESQKPTNVFTILWIANIKPLKRPELFLEVAAGLAEYSNVEFVMAGQPYSVKEKQVELENAIRDMPNVTYLGAITQEEVGRLLDRSHLMVNTSTYEGFSNTFIQAWLRSVPVATLGVNPDGLLNDSFLGKSCASTTEVAEYVRSLARDFDRLTIAGRKSRSFAAAQFSMENARELATLIVNTAHGSDSG